MKVDRRSSIFEKRSRDYDRNVQLIKKKTIDEALSPRRTGRPLTTQVRTEP